MKSRVAVSSFLALIFISLILRPPIAQIGPLLQEITTDLALSSAEASFLTAIPVFCFGLGAFFSPWMMRRFGLNQSMFVVLIILTASVAARVWFGFSSLLLGTVLVGLAIAVANVLLPSFVRNDFGDRASMVTSIYTTLLAISASFTAAVAVLFSQQLGGWNNATMVVLVPAVLAILFWIPRLRAAEPHIQVTALSGQADARAVYRSPLAWAILGFFGLQSLGFYSLLGWLPTMLISAGMQPVAAGAYLGLATAIGIPSGFALAPLISKLKNLSWLAAAASAVTTSGFSVLAFTLATNSSENAVLLVIACVLISVGQTATFPVSLSLIATRASSQAQTTVLSAFSQGWGYLLSGFGTFAFGAIAASFSSWTIVALLIVAFSALQIAIGFYAGRDAKISA